MNKTDITLSNRTMFTAFGAVNVKIPDSTKRMQQNPSINVFAARDKDFYIFCFGFFL